jgi:excisionase family DNA binding protein
MSVESIDAILTISEAAARSSVNRAKIDAAIAYGELRFVRLGPRQRRILASDLSKWWRSKRAKDLSPRGPTRLIISLEPLELTEPDRLLQPAEAAKRGGIPTGKIWSALWRRELGRFVLGPHTNRILLSEVCQGDVPRRESCYQSVFGLLGSITRD